MTPPEQLIQSLTQLINRKATNPYYPNNFIYWEEMKEKIKFIKQKEGIK